MYVHFTPWEMIWCRPPPTEAAILVGKCLLAKVYLHIANDLSAQNKPSILSWHENIDKSWFMNLRLRANRSNNSQISLDLQCIVGRIQPISLCKLCVMSVRGSNNVGRAVQTNPTLLRYASAITEQKKCWELLAEKFDRFQTLRNNMQQGVQTNVTCNIQQGWDDILIYVLDGCEQLVFF